jgi:GT2 family glycosyltransferase/lipopolysaccharide/colanic/teichoic acid biosynthesis glycosyltransferase
VEVKDSKNHWSARLITMQLSVIIVNYNVRVFLENALASVRKALDGISSEVIVVDNASDDNSVEMVQKKFPEVNLIVNKNNMGFAAANNQALRVCHGEFVLLLNPDTVVQEDTFKTMLAFFEQHPQVGLAGCKILNPDGSLQLACRRSFPTPWVGFTKSIGLSNIFPRSKFFGRYNLTYLNPDETYEVDAVSGSFMFIRKKVVDNVGGLDEQFFMYGEDLDLCYRVKQAGWEIYYIPSTQVIHYKGQSVRRSDIDEVKVFYEAMRIFTRKHFTKNLFVDVIIRLGIALREFFAFLMKKIKPLRAIAVDIVVVNISLLLGEFIWLGRIFSFPSYAYPITMIIPALLFVLTMSWFGVYSIRKLSISRTASSVVVGYIVLSALTFFFKQYGFSRMVVGISGLLNFILLPGWRIVVRSIVQPRQIGKQSLFGRRAAIVGVEKSGIELVLKLRSKVDSEYKIIGFIDTTRRRIGEKIGGVEILGSVDNIAKVIEENKISDVIFSADVLSYSDILSVIARSRNKSVNFYLVPNSLEVIIGKAHIDKLDDIPLVDIQYNLERFLNRFNKRLFDIVGSISLMIFIYPIVKSNHKAGRDLSLLGQKIIQLPNVLKGKMSFVGPPYFPNEKSERLALNSIVFYGKPGLTGIIQINESADLTSEEIEKYNVYYAKNQSLMLDVEIILKSFILFKKNRSKNG